MQLRLQRLCVLSFSTISGIRTAMSLSSSPTFLEQARRLEMPSREEMLRRDMKVYKFWGDNEVLLEKGWAEWEERDHAAKSLPALDSSVYHPALRKAIQDAWADPSKEDAVMDLWKEVSPGVYQCQFFDPTKLHIIREYLDKAGESGIPLRPPYGIVLNRKGFMLDPRSNGYLAMPKFQYFYHDLMDSYMRPLGRLFYPEFVRPEDDSETFGFSIQYQPNKDQSIRQHSDGSSLTLNINLNLPNGQEEYSGSSLYFVDPETGKKNTVNFAPGVAVMHLGAIPYAALPITSGERSNLVLWLYGRGGRRSGSRIYGPDQQLSPSERWQKPKKSQFPKDTWAPF